MRRPLRALLVASVAAVVAAHAHSAVAFNPDTLVTVGSPPTPFSQNKQNEPAVAIDANHPNVLVAGANDEIDMEACNAGTDNTARSPPGVGVSGVYFSFDSGTTWIAADLHGLERAQLHWRGRRQRPALHAARRADRHAARLLRERAGLRRRPGGGVRPASGADGGFSWANGSRLYYANLTSNFAPAEQAFKGFEAIAVSRIDDRRTGRRGDATTRARWKAPVIVSKQNSSRCSPTRSRSGPTTPRRARSSATSTSAGGLPRPGAGQRSPAAADRGDLHRRRRHWTSTRSPRRPTTAQRNRLGDPAARSAPTATASRTCSAYQFASGLPGKRRSVHVASTDGGANWTKAAAVSPATDQLRRLRARRTAGASMDGVAGARNDLAPGAERGHRQRRSDRRRRDRTGSSMTLGDGRDGLNHEHVLFTDVHQRRRHAGRRRGAIETPGDRGYYTAPAISPERDRRLRRLQRLHHAVPATTRPTPRALVGVVGHADVARRRRRARSPRCTAARRGDPRASAARTTWPPSSSATTSTPPRPGPTGRRSGTTPARPPTARPSTPTVRRSTTRRSRSAGRWPRPRSRVARRTRAVEPKKTQERGGVAPAVQQACGGDLRELRHLRRDLHRPEQPVAAAQGADGVRKSRNRG